ncbi:hypothetical protein EF847_05885 [Actinobacteria bacterium YIM 96077]|uniref:Uncharacterized protein n=1 Tax=Phytoactinopolyspora halophila TaxID=1981511 RepID=A0A329QNF0_9ACTN|nr:hypothetical protein [Phytoactinopolyspora halophila]AYY12309.1 hypothetical protein EF847_05885 [Actinobacteria bacterium YIM 96077]RAW13773.1 hypothetical protein DPM12_12270 [Phytoactinopolyspora halophila]
MNSDDQIRRMFDDVRFSGEPPMASTASDDVSRGRRHLRRRRMAAWGSGVAGATALVTGAALVVPGEDPGGPELDVAGGSAGDGMSAEQGRAGTSEESEQPTESERPPGIGEFSKTRQLLLDTAIEHFDPEQEHLPDEVTGGQQGSGADGALYVGTKLGWSVPGEDGLGLVQVAVTTPDYVESSDHAFESIAHYVGCEMDSDSCTEQDIPGTDETAWVNEGDAERNLEFGVIHERADGSLVSVGIHDLFGNNSTEPVSGVDIDLDQAFAFVTDPELQIDAAELENASEQREARERFSEPDEEELDFSRTDTEPAPQTEEMDDADVQEALQKCTESAPSWEGFEPVFGLTAETDVDAYVPTGWVIAQRGDTKLLCEFGSSGNNAGGALFGSSEAKDSPYLTAPVESKRATFGLYTSSVDRVTVQTSGGPEQDAIMRDGYWFFPHDGNDAGRLALRGYDDEGELIYDSTEDDAECYTDPGGTEVIRPGSDEDLDPEDCRPMVEWDH